MQYRLHKKGVKRVLLLLLTVFFLGCQPESSTIRHDWPTYSADKAGSKYAHLDQINTSNVRQLELIWKYNTGDMRERPATTIECNPIIIDTVMYLTTPGLKVIALAAATGKELWRFDPYAGKQARGVNRGVTYYDDGQSGRIFYVAGSNLYALNAATGQSIPSFGQEGIVDLYEGLGREVRSTWVTAATPGIIYQDLLIMGSTLGEGPGPAAPGHIRAFDVNTGAMRWIFHTIPHPGEFGYDWTYQLDAGAYATPATYVVDGKQYVVIAAGGGGKPGTKAGGHYYCFGLR